MCTYKKLPIRGANFCDQLHSMAVKQSKHVSEILRSYLSKGYNSCFFPNKFRNGYRELNDDLCDTSNRIKKIDVLVLR